MLDELSSEGFLIYKTLEMAVFPLTWMWVLLIATVLFLSLSQTATRLRVARVTVCCTLGLIWGLGTESTSSYLTAALEHGEGHL